LTNGVQADDVGDLDSVVASVLDLPEAGLANGLPLKHKTETVVSACHE
jgi:hypothetical protein